MNLNQLATLYRPTEFEDVAGHDLSVRALRGMVETKELPTGLLFSGASGTGKTTLARIVASKLDADVLEVDAASHGGVAEVRKLTESLRYTSGKEYKVLILDEAHSLTRDAFNALLKTLEEPPTNVLFILVTTDPHKLPKTVRTRLIDFSFRPLTPIEIAQRLVQVIKEESIPVSPDIIRYVATNSGGSMRKALTDIGLCATAGVTTVEEYLQLVGDGDLSIPILQRMEQQDLDGMYGVLDKAMTQVATPSAIVGQLITALRDLMVINAGDKSGIVRDERAAKTELARILIPERVFAMLRVLWDLKTQAYSRGDSKQDVELALALLYDVMNKGRDAAPKEIPVAVQVSETNSSEQGLSLDDLQELG
jgi:DNA polymerase-3 subunit gamma/tau